MKLLDNMCFSPRKTHWLYFLIIFLASCNGQNRTNHPESNPNQKEGEFSQLPVFPTINTQLLSNMMAIHLRTLSDNFFGNAMDSL